LFCSASDIRKHSIDSRGALCAIIYRCGAHAGGRCGAGDDFDLAAVFAKIEREGKLTLRISIADWINPPGLSGQHLADAAYASRADKDEGSFQVGKLADMVLWTVGGGKIVYQAQTN
jgi:hypothetical protein